jgi:hypothetical protein
MDEPTVSNVSFGEAEYMMEKPLPCPHCHQLISSVVIVSTLPRRGHVAACPACQGILSVGLGGL